MKTKITLLAVCLTIVGLPVYGALSADDYVSQGRVFLAQTNITAANTCFSNAVATTPGHAPANLFYAATRLLLLPNQPGISQLLTRLGVSATGRNLLDWSATMPDNPVLAGINASEFGAALKGQLVPLLAAAEANLGKITNSDFSLVLTAQETRSSDLTIDYGDVQMMRAMLQAAQYFSLTISSWDLNVQLTEIKAYLTGNSASIEQFLKKYPKLLNYASGADLNGAKTAFLKGAQNYMAASEFIRNRPPGTLRLFNSDNFQASDEANFRATLSDLTNSLSAPVVLSVDTNYTVSLAEHFNGSHPLRSFLPQFRGNRFLADSLPDPTFGGLLSGIPASKFEEALESKFPTVVPGVTFSEVLAFRNWSDNPSAALVLGKDGNFYGASPYGGNYSCGSIVKITPRGVLTTLHSFSDADGNEPNSLIVGNDGTLYGTTQWGGDAQNGTVFSLTPTGQFQILASFSYNMGIEMTVGRLLQGADGNLYGMAVGPSSQFAVYKVTPSGEVSILASHEGSPQGDSLIQDSEGNLYGAAGSDDLTSTKIIRVTLAGEASVIWTSDNSDWTVLSSYAFGADNALYSLTAGSDSGSLYKIYKNGTSTNLISFKNTQPISLSKGIDQNLYITSQGGAEKLFQFTPQGALSTKFFFDDAYGSNPSGQLAQAPDGSIYGVTKSGGSRGNGNLFKLNIASAPVATVSPSIIATNPAATVRFTATASGTAPLSYQWYKNSAKLSNTRFISGATTAVLTIANTTVNDAGAYSVVVRNSLGEAAGSAVLNILALPAITLQPAATLRPIRGAAAALKVVATGLAPLCYQWKLNGVDIDGATNSAYAFIAQASAGVPCVYSVVVTNDLGVTRSQNANVLILPDTVKPSVTIATPLANSRSAAPMIAGVAADNVRLSRVTCWVVPATNNTVSFLATNIPIDRIATAILRGTNSTFATWDVALPLLPGTNLLCVQGMDFQGNLSPLVTRTFFYKTNAPLNLTLAGTGSGTVSGKTDFLGEVVPANGALLNIGQGYSITATPNSMSLFSNWSGSFGLSNNPTLRFTMQPGLTLQANFVTNLFLRMTGIYNGLFSAPDGVRQDTAGMLSGFTLGSKGNYSGRILFNGGSYTITGNFDLSGRASNSIPSRPVALLNLNLDLQAQRILGAVSGTLSNAPWTSSLTALMATNSIKPNSYTMLLTPTNEWNGGYSFASITNKLGIATLTGSLADGSPITQTVPVSGYGLLPVYIGLPRNTGMLQGWISLDGDMQGELTWIKKPSLGRYARGFTNVLSLTGSPWTAPAANTPAISLPSGSLELFGADLVSPLSLQIALNNKNLFIKTTNTPVNTLTGSVDPKTGLLKNVIVGNGRAPISVFGAVLQNTTNAGGFFLGRTNSGTVILHP